MPYLPSFMKAHRAILFECPLKVEHRLPEFVIILLPHREQNHRTAEGHGLGQAID